MNNELIERQLVEDELLSDTFCLLEYSIRIDGESSEFSNMNTKIIIAYTSDKSTSRSW